MGKYNVELDCLGKMCPMPIVKLNLAVRKLNSGELAFIKADDLAFRKDVEAWAKAAGHKIVEFRESGEILSAVIQKK